MLFIVIVLDKSTKEVSGHREEKGLRTEAFGSPTSQGNKGESKSNVETMKVNE